MKENNFFAITHDKNFVWGDFLDILLDGWEMGSFIHSFSDGDISHRLIDIRGDVCRRLGYCAEELIGRSLLEIVHPADVKDLSERLKEWNGDGSFCWKGRVLSAAGKSVAVETHARLFRQGGRCLLVGGMRDVSGRRRMEFELEESRRFQLSVLDQNPNPIMVIDPDTSVRYVNRAFERITRFSAGEIVGRGIPYPWWPEERRDELEADIWEYISDHSRSLEQVYVKRTGERFWVELKEVTRFDREGHPEYCLITWVDITERRGRFERLRNQCSEMARKVFQSLGDSVFLVELEKEDVPGRIVDVNDEMCRMSGFSTERLLGATLCDLFPRSRPEDLVTAVAAVKTGGFLQFEDFMRCRDGSLRPMEIRMVVLQLEEDYFLLTSARDISQRKKAEHKERLYREQLQSLSAQLVLAEERERRSIASDIHDTVGQSLALLKIRLDMLCQPFSEKCLCGENLQEIERMEEILDGAIRCSRTLTSNLGSPILYDLGLDEAIEKLADKMYEEYGLVVMRDGEDLNSASLEMNEETKIFAFRSIRELLLNVARHSGSRKAMVSLCLEDDFMRVQVRDWGTGFDVGACIEGEAVNGYGLFSIRERLRWLGGSFFVESKIGSGTIATMMIPVKEISGEEKK